MRRFATVLAATAMTISAYSLAAQAASSTSLLPPHRDWRPPSDSLSLVPPLTPLVGHTASELANVLVRFSTDQSNLARRYDAPDSPAQRKRMRQFYGAWRGRLRDIDFEKLSQEGRVDYVLLDNHLVYQLALMDRADKSRAELASLMPYADGLLTLQDTRRDLVSIDGSAAARTVSHLVRVVDSARTMVERGGPSPRPTRTSANRAADETDRLRGTLGNWYRFYNDFDPVFTWWLKDPYAQLDDALARYARTLRERIVGISAAQLAASGRGGAAGRSGGAGGRGGDNRGSGDLPPATRGSMSAGESEPIIGDPIGAEGLKADLVHEMIPYTPDELIAIAEHEYAFSLSEAKKAAHEMGFGDNWKGAMEKVKETYVEPGKQPELIRDLARQAEAFFDQHDWVTIPSLAKEDWYMEMLSPERQRVSPFFLGGDQILVSYPTEDMSEDDKMMSMRGNNPHFSHATVFHELNPGHHLQGWMEARYNTQRRMFSTPFWSEGQSLYWEMFLWDHGFQVSPEDRMGALFWRMHRSARIIFSLSFHLGKMTPEQAINFLVDTVDFERANAEAEVRRSFNGSYPPLYQVGYMIGGLELRALHHELVDTKKMTDREFHDGVLQGGPMPIAMVRARLAKTALTRSGAAPWRFADELPPPVPAPQR